jgi:hypothetical protein
MHPSVILWLILRRPRVSSLAINVRRNSPQTTVGSHVRSMSDLQGSVAPEAVESPSRRLRRILEWPAIFTTALAFPFLADRRTRAWDALAFGLAYAHHVTSDVQRGMTSPDGRTTQGPYGYPRSAYVRSADPLGFWILIALKGSVAAAAVLIALGELFGLWNFLG